MTATLFPCPYYVFCDIFNCRSLAKWYVGKATGPINCTFKLCDKCAHHLANNLPVEIAMSGATPLALGKDDLRESIESELRAKINDELVEELTPKIRMEVMKERKPQRKSAKRKPQKKVTS